MEIGIVTARSNAEAALAAGVDYVEPHVVSGLDGGHPGPFPAFAVLFPGHFRLADPTWDTGITSAYLEAAAAGLARIATQGATVVFGSGTARSIPEGVSRSTAEDLLADVLRLARHNFQPHGLEVILEPLRHQESNIFNTVTETVDFLDRHDLSDVRIVSDAFHQLTENEPVADVVAVLDRVAHVHLADEGRRPVTARIWPVLPFARALLDAGYAGRMSVECEWGDFDSELAASVALIRSDLSA